MSWIDVFKRKIVSPTEALRCIQSGDRVYIHPGCAEPEVLVQALYQRAPELHDVELLHLLTLGSADYVRPEMEGHFRHNSMFIGGNVREAVNAGRADYMPIFLGEIEGLFLSGVMPLDVALITVTPPDEHGYCSLGVGVDTTMTAVKVAKHVVAEVNDQMPRTLGDTFVHVSKLDFIVESSRPLCELPQHDVTDLHRMIARNIADLIEDGSTLQMGIGGIPDAVLLYLKDKKDLGVHSEMFSDGIIDLIEMGVVNGERKSIHPRKVIVGFCLGTKRLFDFIHNNPIFEFHPTSYTNDPFRIAQNDRMVAINAALQVDLTGQVAADSIGSYFYSGFGGQVDFIRGAARSKGGKPIIALPATAKDDSISRIAPILDPGAGVVTSRADVHYVVSEYGVAYLHGKNIRQRAEALINIAHPKFRNELLEYSSKQRWLKPAEKLV